MISFRSTCRSLAHGSFGPALLLLFLGAFSLAVPADLSAQELGSARLQIAGTRLVVTPTTQTVPLETSTVVETHLEGYDPELGVLPGDLRVVADFTGPGLESGLRLESFPNEPLRVPALRTKGEYFLENIRLMQGDDLLTYAEPRTASVLATQILISSVSTRALTEDEIRNYGIVIGDDSRQAINLTFAFGFEGQEIEYSMPVVFRHFGPEDWGQPARMELPRYTGRTINTARFEPPRPVPFKVELERVDFLEEPESPSGGCPIENEPCRQLEPPEPPMVGVVFFPTEMSLLHQFFSVVLMVQNGAPEGDVLTISDLTARVQVPSGLRQASTEPPTPLGVPVPVRVPGADGEVGTSDDLTILVAQATGQAEFLVEGMEQGTHIVEFDMEGMLHGLPEGPRRITGSAQGAVTVRDPTLSASISHPTVVRKNTSYSTFFTITNLGNQPVNGVQISLPTSGLAGTRLADGEVNTKDLGSLLPGESASAEFEMEALISGSLAATSTRAGSGVSPLFEFSVGVENGIPLSPETLALPSDIDALPEEMLAPAQRMLGLAHSLSTAPFELVRDKPQVTRGDVDERAYRLVEAARVYRLGEPLFETASYLLAEWAGGRDGSWEWDELRRLSDPALEMAEYVGATMFVTEPDADAALDRFAGSTFGFEPWLAMSTYGEIEVASRVSGKSSFGFLGDAVRDLPFAELMPLGDSELAMITQPEEEGHRVTVRRTASGGVDLRVVLPSGDGADMRSISWSAVSLDAGGSAWVDVVNDGTTLQLQVDGDADGVAEYQIPGSEQALAPRPFEAVAAVQNHDVDPSGHVVDVLFTRDLGLASLIPRDPERFQVEGRISNGGVTPTEQDVGGGILGIPVTENPFDGLSNPRIVRVVFNNPMGPLQSHDITIDDLQSALGESLVRQTLPVQITLEQPGIRLEGTVIDSYGQPLPGARVTLYESDLSGIGNYAECSGHATAVAVADAQGRYAFEYVRQTDCSDVFEVKALAPGEPRWGSAKGRVRFVGETQELDIVMLGRAIVEGRVTHEDGSAPEGLRVTAMNHVMNEGRAAWTDDEGNYRMAEVPVGTVQLSAWDALGNRVFQTIEVPTAGARIVRDLVMLRRQEESSGTVRGSVVRHTTSEEIAGAVVALYVDEQLVGWRETDWEGDFDFGRVPTGLVELQAFDVTGLEGAQVFTQLEPDQVIDQELRLTDERGTVAGRVMRRASDGTLTPFADAIVYIDLLPENTRTDADGMYRLEDIPFGTHSVVAVDLPANETASSRVTVDSSTQDSLADIFFTDPESQVPSSLTGTVLDRNGNPVSGATIHLAEGYYSVRWATKATSDADGKYRFDNVLGGVHAVHAHEEDDGGIAWGEIRFPGDSDDVTVQFAGGMLRGRTFYKDTDGLEVPVASTIYYRHVEVVDDWDLVAVSKDWKELVTEADGTFAVPVLNGPYELIAHNAFHGSKRASGFFDAFSEEIPFEFDRNGSISGTLWLEDGETPAVGADVTLRGGEISEFTVQTDENGRFFFDLLKKGQYEITALIDEGAIFRTERVWAYLRESGDEIDIDVVLPKQGTIEGWVEDADGFAVPGAIVELAERGYPWRKIRQTTDGEGNYYFQNIFEGDVTLTAQAPSLGGLGATGGAQVTDEGQEVLTLLILEGVGTVEGTILSPATGDVVANARVRLDTAAGHFFSSTNSDLDGRFEFKQLPLGFYVVNVFDPTTGRYGLGETVEVTHHGQIVPADVTLEVRGIVDGHIYDPPSNDPVPGATIRLTSQGIQWFTTYSSSGVDGYFSFEGIPEGNFSLYANVDGRAAQNSGEIVEEDQVVTRDLYLEALGTIFGVVLGPRNIDGVPGPPMTNVNVTVMRWRSMVGASTENPFLIDRIVPANVDVVAKEAGEIREALVRLRVEEGGEHEVEMVMPALGTATVQVDSSIGEPIPFAQVQLVNRTIYEKRHTYNKTADSNGWVTFQDVVEGDVWISATDPATGLRGAESTELTYEGQNLGVEVYLEPTATVRGTVFLSDGVTPGEGVVVAIRVGNASWQTVETDEAGLFEFTPLRLGGFDLEANDPVGPGSYATSGVLQADQEVQEFTLVLDDEDPYVVSMTPVSMSRDLPLSTQVTLRFNEPLAACSTDCHHWFAFERVQGGSVPFNVAWSEGDTVATLSPTQSLASATTYRIRVKNRAVDLAERVVDPLFSGGFTTADVVPPSVIDLDPLPDAVQVPVSSTITIQFSEPVDVESLSGAFQITDLTTGQPITVTTLVRLDETGVVLTPVQDFELNREIEVRVTGVSDPAGNVQPSPFVMTFWTPDTAAPEVQWLEPSALQTYTAGDLIDFEARVTDNQGTARVRFELDEWVSPWLDAQVDPGPPEQSTEEIFSAQLPAPIRSAASDVVVRTVAEDVWGNVSVSELTIRVEPLANPSAPAFVATCPADLDFVAPGVPLVTTIDVADDLGIESAWLEVDGAWVDAIAPVIVAESTLGLSWTPDADAAPGQSFALQYFVRDFSGNLTSRLLTAQVPQVQPILEGEPLVGSQLYLSAGEHVSTGDLSVNEVVVLGGATWSVDPVDLLSATSKVEIQCSGVAELARVDAPTVRVERGAVLRTPRIEPTDIAAALFEVEEGGLVDGIGRGFYGVHGSGTLPDMPPGVEAPVDGAGASHGGLGTHGNALSNQRVYGSVYVPHWSGTGGGEVSLSPGSGAFGGGALRVSADQVVVDGRIDVRGRDQAELTYQQGAAGAGGSVFIDTALLSGSGRINARGGEGVPAHQSGAGGGGRIAIHAGGLQGFDPALQAVARGGYNEGRSPGGPGTVYLRTPDYQGGVLWLRNVAESGDVLDSGVVELPGLGTGDVSASQVEGADRWVFADADFHVAWLGASMRLRDASGGDLGTYRVVEVDGVRVLLEGAGTVTGAATYEGVYRFDEVHAQGVELRASDDVQILGEVYLEGENDLAAGLNAGSVTVRAEAQVGFFEPWNVSGDLVIETGAVIRTSELVPIEITAGGRIELHGGAKIDADATGYRNGQGPPGLDPDPDWGSGSHGGHASDGTEEVLDVYDSVYLPNLSGGGGYWFGHSLGGGVVVLRANEMILDGNVSASSLYRADSAGAGGTIRLHAQALSGSGYLDAKTAPESDHAGGGRIAIWAEQLAGFDPVAQSRAWGAGREVNAALGGAAGTVLLHTADSTYGRLVIDNGAYESGSPRTTLVPTVLPQLDSGVPAAATAEGDDLLLDLGTLALQRWAGAYVELFDAANAFLGEFRVIEPAGSTILVVGAGSVAGQVASYRGVYRFDRVDVLNGAQFDWADPTPVDEMVFSTDTLVSAPIEARTIRLTSSAVLRPSGRHPIALRADESIVIEEGAVIDVSGMGFEGFGPYGTAPEGILAAGDDSGGSHGGRGRGDELGEVFGSVYYPEQAGGSGASYGDGGGVILLNAPSVQLDGALLALGDIQGYEGAGGTVRIEAGQLSGLGWIDASAPVDNGGAGGGGRVALWVDTLVGFDPETQVNAASSASPNTNGPTTAAGTIFVRTSSSVFGDLLVDNRRLDERDPADDIVRKAYQTELPSLGEGSPSAVTVDGTDLLLDLGEEALPRWLRAWVELLDSADTSLGVFEVSALVGNSIRVDGAAAHVGAVATYRGTYRFDSIDVRGGAGLQVFDASRGEIVRLAGNAEFGGPWTADQYVVESGAEVWPIGFEPLVLQADTSVTIDAGAVVSATGRSQYEGNIGDPNQVPEHVDGGDTYYGAHGGFSLGATGELYGSVYFPRFAGGSGYSQQHGGGVIRIEAPTIDLHGLVEANASTSRTAAGTIAIDAVHLAGSGQVRADGTSGSGGGRVAIRALQTMSFDASTQASAAGGAYYWFVRGGVGTVYVYGPDSTWGDLLLDNEEFGLSHQGNEPYTYLPRLGTGTVGLAESDADNPANLWVEPTAAGLVFDLGVEGMWFRSGGSDYRILEEDGSRRRILLEGAAGLVNVGDSYSGLYRFDSVIVENSSYLRVDDATEVGSWNISSDSAVEASSLAIDVTLTSFNSATEGTSYLLTADFVDQELGQTHTATIDWGDGTIEAGLVVDGDSGSVSAQHTWTQDGTYSLEVCVTDGDGREGCASLAVEVANADPVVAFEEPPVEVWPALDEIELGTNPLNRPQPKWNLFPDTSPRQSLAGARSTFALWPGPTPSRARIEIRNGNNLTPGLHGLALGYFPGDAQGRLGTDYLLLVWDQAQPGDEFTERGLHLYRVQGVSDLWTMEDNAVLTRLASAATLGSQSTDSSLHLFEYEHTGQHLRVWVDENLEFDLAVPVEAGTGRLGLFNHRVNSFFYDLQLVSDELQELDPYSVTGSGSDLGIEDLHTATIDWGDGSPVETVSITQSAGGVEFTTAEHVYSEQGQYFANLCVQDQDGGEGCTARLVAVANRAATVTGGTETLALGAVSEVEAATYVDVSGDVHTATIDWGAGPEPATVELTAPGEGRVLVAPPSQVGNWLAQVCVTDDDGATGCDVFDLTVEGVAAPEVLSATAAGEEGSDATLTATFSDADADDLHTATIDWGGGPVTASVDQETDTVTAAFTFAEDGSYPITVCVTDLAAMEHCLASTATIANAAPVVTAEAGVLTADEGSAINLADTSFTDAGVADVHTATIDWGDSASEASTVTGSAGTGSVAGASHVYTDDGGYLIEVCVLDDDGAEGCDTVDVTVTNVAPVVTSAGSVALDGVTEKELATYVDAGTADVHTATIDWGDGSTTAGTVEVTGTGTGRVLGDHNYATGGVFTAQVCVVDDSGDSHCASVEVSSADSVPPTVSVAGVNASYSAGETLSATITTADEVGVERVEVTFDGGLTTLTEGGPVFTYTTQVDPTLTTPRDTTLEVVAFDFSGNASTTHHQSVHLGVDLPPDLTLTVDPERADDRYTSGEALTFVAEATDNVLVASLEIDVDGAVTSGSSPLTVTWTAPPVAQPTAVVVTATAVDDNGNTSVETLNLQVDPLANGIPPEVTFNCPSDGATLPSAYDLPLQLTATDDAGVSQVDLYLDDETTPFATAVPSVGGTLSFDVSETLTLPTVGGASQSVRIRAVVTDASFNSVTEEITLDVVETTDLATDGSNDWTALASSVGVLRSGTLELSQPRTLGGLIVLDGALLTHPQSAPGAETALDLAVAGPVYVACGGAVDATAKGYPANQTYPGEINSANGSGGSHVGVGGQYSSSLPGTTYGSVYYPAGSGAGGQHSSNGRAGGGVVMLQASTLVVDGSIRADGDGWPTGGYRGGAGGSVWLDVAGSLSGSGSIEATGGEVPGGYGAGGGGAVAIYHGGLSTEMESSLSARGGSGNIAAGTGSVYLFGPTSTYGDLAVNAGSVPNGITDLPALGSGIAQAGSSGTILETDLVSIQPFFVGHWVEIYDASGTLEGVWRVTSISGTTLTLAAGATADAGDTWQGVYRFDNVELTGEVELRSEDPIRVAAEQVIDGLVETERITGHDLVLRSGATLTHPATTDPSNPRVLEIFLSGRLTVEPGSEIDVSAKGFGPHLTYPGETSSANGSGGSHLGLGGQYSSNLPGTSYGSLYYPAEPGAGGQHSDSGLAGGGVVIVEAAELVLDGTIRANGDGRPSGGYRAGAGGSIWLDVTGQVSGAGSIEATGGEVPGGYGAGGGGAIAIYHGGLSGDLSQGWLAQGGAANIEGGAGSLFLHGPTSTYGDLIVDAGSVADGITDLPALGSGIAQAGSSGTLLATGLTSVQAYFVGHWVEIYDASGALEGSWRIASIDGGNLSLEPGASVDPGDAWQGVYRFDNVELTGEVELRSEDPIRVAAEQVIDGLVETERITGHDLVLRSGATLTHPATTSSANPQRLVIELSGDLTVEAGAKIDVTGRGYPRGTTHEGEEKPGSGTGGHHIGRGGYHGGAAGTTYGSVYFPWEPGGAGENGSYGSIGGGVVYVSAGGNVLINGEIRADGEQQTANSRRGGAGGSIWIDAGGAVSGAGTVSARGSQSTSSLGSGGGGAIAIYSGGLDADLQNRVLARGGDLQKEGGAGSVYLIGPTSTYGDLIVDAGTVVDGVTDLPSLGSGLAQAGSTGTLLATGLTSVQAYFVGHWVEIYDASGALEGSWRIASIDGGNLSLEPGASVDPGDAWQGVYRFDNVELTGEVELRSEDPIRVAAEQVIDGLVETERITGHDLVLRSGATLTHPATTSSANPQRLVIELSGDLTLETGSKIDVTGRGYPRGTTHEGEEKPGSGTGGHHIGRGGYHGGAAGTTYGSVYFPWEPGGAGENGTYGSIGGGVLYVSAGGNVLINGEIRADGEQQTANSRRGGAGGSIWIDAGGTVSGAGSVSAQGSQSTSSLGSGGGGAIAIYSGGLDVDLLNRVLARGGDLQKEGGAGSVYLFGPTSTYGDLIVDNADIVGGWTELPALGAGTAQSGSAADVLVTDLAAAVQPYFIGHWVEIYDGATSDYEGSYRIAEILPDGLSVVLAPNGVDTPSVDPDDFWQGVYLFDDVLLTGDALGFTSDDPVIVTGTQTLSGAITTERIFGGHLVLDTDTLLTHPPEDGSLRGLDLRLTGDLTMGSGAAIDVSGQGYGPRVAYPGAGIPGGAGAGSHMGLGGYSPGTTYGSVIRPWEHGGGGEHSSAGGPGGGKIRIEAHDLVFTDATGSILANGLSTTHGSARGGAGGSIWIELTGQLQGDGAIEAVGAAGAFSSGGGGALSISHQGSTGSALGAATAWGGDLGHIGGAGTIFVRGPSSTEGDLIVRSAGIAGQDTVLPSLGQGTAGVGSSGSSLVTGLASAVPDYFMGHWVEVSTSGGTVKGTFPIQSIAGTTLILSDDGGVPPSVDEGDTWRGVYRFDSVTVEDATLSSSDGIFESGTEIVP